MAKSTLLSKLYSKSLILTALGGLSLGLSGCEGCMDWVYDDPVSYVSVDGELYIDASNWKKWYYVNLTDTAAISTVLSSDIPSQATGETQTQAPSEHLSGLYLYWFDAFGQGIQVNEFRSFTPTEAQTESDPNAWTFAVHRNNVRTNPNLCFGVAESTLTDIDQATEALASQLTYSPDEWSEKDVWCDQSQMLLALVPSQGIMVNKVLSNWLLLEIPPMPPSFQLNNHVFFIRMHNGTYAALQLVDYMSAEGVKCCLTIKYRYPL